ncbi:hypothetical protein DL766_003738 [Monosporascus sp. MC13-8B]|uniref:Uncharacterized protein n=1 Tax=Monosporascus cannonballus TaxID=155416 RepID=A0ABY0GYL9_9PEZI|nr:hypothetical protein DL763_010316 [Monosporascus cannonballus]RYO80357.1 hypothetical protein DL762_007682 [Monosporascus cannonballus]RYP32932.1 hypothetical protein DL766_003738 [Monosporascus sp. MC13-8B]
MASPTLVEISRSDLKETYIPQATITEVRHLTSYSWLEKSVPTISVPGLPPIWSPPSRPMKLAPDSGMVYIDQNAARSPRSPIEPLFRALYAQHPGFEIDDIDLVTDRNNIRKLLRFVQASSAEPFKVRIEIAGDHTAIFTRAETKTNERIEGFKGFGHNFERAYTKRQNLLSYRRLCESLQHGMVDVLGGRNLRGILNDMRRGKEEWDPEERRDTAVRSLARDSAFRLLYILILGEPLSEAQNKAMVYNVVFSVVSHRRIFRYGTRKMVREAFEARFQPSYKQLKELEKWQIQGSEEEEDVTTEEEDYFDSDWSFRDEDFRQIGQNRTQ